MRANYHSQKPVKVPVLASIGDVIKIWRSGRLWTLGETAKKRAMLLTMEQLARTTITTSQRHTLETLRNALEG